MLPRARFLVLCDEASDALRASSTPTPTSPFPASTAPLRALLFDSQQRWLGEVIEEDGFIVANLLRSARECPMPRADMLQAVAAPPSARQPLRCFDLG